MGPVTVNRPADGPPVVEPLERGLRNGRILERASRTHVLVAEVREGAAVVRIRARPRNGVDDTPRDPAVLGLEVCRLHLDLGDRVELGRDVLRAGRVGVVVHAVDLPEVGAGARPEEGGAFARIRRSRYQDQEGPEVARDRREQIELIPQQRSAGLRGRRLDNRNVRPNRDLLCHAAGLQRKVNGCFGANGELHAGSLRDRESRQLGGELVFPWRECQEPIKTSIVTDRRAGQAGVDLPGRQGHPGHGGLQAIRDHPDEGGGIRALSLRSGRQEQGRRRDRNCPAKASNETPNP